MALPPGITSKTVTLGIASFADGSLANGRATISMPVNVVHTPTNRPIFSSDMTKPFVDGEASFDLLPNDAPGLNRVDWSYKLKIEVQGATVQPEVIYFLLPSAGPDVVDLDGLVTVPSSAGIPISVDVLTTTDFGPALLDELNDTGSDVSTALRAAFVALWKPTEVIAAGAFRLAPDGTVIQRNSSGTTRASYDGTEAALWTVKTGAGGGSSYTDEQARDAIGAALRGGGGLTVTLDDAGDIITIAAVDATTTAKGIVELATGAETITGSDTVRAVTPAGAKAAISAAISAASRTSIGNRGKIVWIVDDADLSHRDIAAPKIEAVGGKLNLAIPWSSIGLNAQTMVAADVTTLYNAGHQIMSHSMTHPNMTTQTPAQRMAEWDTAKANLEAITAVGAITDFVYPNNASNLATTIEAYGRYLRTYNGGFPPGLIRPGENSLTIPRATWGTGTHQQVLDAIKRIAVTGETLVLYCHTVATAATSAINPTMLDEAIALTTSLGVQWSRADEVLTSQPSPFLDFGFETGDLTGAYHTIVSKGAGCTIDIVTDTPADGLPGTKSLRMVNDGSGTLNRVSPVAAWPTPRAGEEYTLSGRIRQDKTSGTGGGQLILRQLDEFGGNLGDVNTTAITTVGTTAWTQVSIAFTAHKLARSFTVWAAQSTMIGTTWFDHLHFGPTRLGVLG